MVNWFWQRYKYNSMKKGWCKPIPHMKVNLKWILGLNEQPTNYKSCGRK